jgi:glycerol-3-phosphate responsive antiterminator
MPKSIIRKEKIVLCNNINNNDIVTFNIVIDSNHVNNNLDQLLQTLTSCINALPGYKVQEKEEKEKPKPKSKKNKFGDGHFV